MELQHSQESLYQWLFPDVIWAGPIVTFLIVVVSLIVLACFLSYLVCVVRHGPFEAFYVVAQVIFTSVPDLLRTSPRRTLAMARLAVKESIRRRVLVVFAMFAVLLLFGAWFLNTRVDDPARLYLSFVMTMTSYLTVILAVFLSTFSLPNDIKNKTIYTVITKPVRAGEIILGRILGFTFIGTIVMVSMCAVSYLFVVRGLGHDHEIALEDAEAVLAPGGEMTAQEVEAAPETSEGGGHKHKLIRRNGRLALDHAASHTHRVEKVGEGPDAKYVVGAAEGMLEARVPHYGELSFLDKATGQLTKPTHVGYEWEYRMHVEGASNAAAVWTFDDVSPERYPTGLPIEMTIDVYRTYKGDIEQRIRGSITLVRPGTDVRSAPLDFVSDEFTVQQLLFPRKWKLDNSDNPVDIFQQFVDKDGRIEIWLQCTEPGQFFGAAQGDLYLRSAEGYFGVNFAKAYLSMWMQMVLVICFGVMFSSFLSGAVAMLATILSLVIGFYAQSISDLANDVLAGGGPFESFIRVLTHRSAALKLEGPAAPVVDFLDDIFRFLMRLALQVLPRFNDFNTSDYVAEGYSIYGDLLSQHFVITLAYCFVLSVTGYFFLRTREIAA
ncbi:MAG: ABC transporter permease [Pirellulaceae bacterium]